MATGFAPKFEDPIQEESKSEETVEVLSPVEQELLAEYEQARITDQQRREETKTRLVAKYLGKTPNESVRAFIGKHVPDFAQGIAQGDQALTIEEELASIKLTSPVPELGLWVGTDGKARLKSPSAEKATGQYVGSEILKAFLVGWKNAKRPDERLEVIRDMYDYLGLPMPTQALENEVQENENEGLFPWIQRHARELTALAAVLMVSASGLDLRKTEGQANAMATSEGEIAVKKETIGDEYALKEGETLITVARKLLQEHGVSNPTGTQIYQVTGQLARANDVGVPGWNIKGDIDERKLPVGFKVDTRRAREVIAMLGR